MNIVKEHIIFEKFKEESDPVHDMNIGFFGSLKERYNKACKKSIEELSKIFFYTYDYTIETYFIMVIVRNSIYKNHKYFQKIFEKYIKLFSTEKMSNEYHLINIDKIIEILDTFFNISVKNTFKNPRYYPYNKDFVTKNIEYFNEFS